MEMSRNNKERKESKLKCNLNKNKSRKTQHNSNIESADITKDEDCKNLKRNFSKNKLVQCSQCRHNEVKNQSYKCSFCKHDKCLKCAENDAILTKQNLKKSLYFCSDCFKNKAGSTRIQNDRNRPHVGQTLLGRKKRKSKDKVDETPKNPDEEACDQPSFIDFDKLMKTVTPPSELEYHSLSKKYKQPRSKDISTALVDSLLLDLDGKRKSKRAKKQEEEDFLINCHQCKTIDTISNILTCGNLSCLESYCLKCFKKSYAKDLTPSRLLKIQISSQNKTYIIFNNSWICSKCKPTVEKTPSNHEDNKNLEGPKVSKTLKKRRKIGIVSSQIRKIIVPKILKQKSNIITIPLLQLPDNKEIVPKNIVQIDDFIVYENSCSESLISDIEMESEDNDENKEQLQIIEIYEKPENLKTNQMPEKEKTVEKVKKNNFAKHNNNTLINNPIKCIVCLRQNVQPCDILKFSNYEDFFVYFRYFIKLNLDHVTSNKIIFDENINQIKLFIGNPSYDLYSKMHFKRTQKICKYCFIETMNKENALEKILMMTSRDLDINQKQHVSKFLSTVIKPTIQDKPEIPQSFNVFDIKNEISPHSESAPLFPPNINNNFTGVPPQFFKGMPMLPIFHMMGQIGNFNTPETIIENFLSDISDNLKGIQSKMMCPNTNQTMKNLIEEILIKVNTLRNINTTQNQNINNLFVNLGGLAELLVKSVGEAEMNMKIIEVIVNAKSNRTRTLQSENLQHMVNSIYQSKMVVERMDLLNNEININQSSLVHSDHLQDEDEKDLNLNGFNIPGFLNEHN